MSVSHIWNKIDSDVPRRDRLAQTNVWGLFQTALSSCLILALLGLVEERPIIFSFASEDGGSPRERT